MHGSRWIQKEIIADLIRRGAYAAAPGEFTQRAFINGRLDLAQAEGVADLIAFFIQGAHKLAISQTRGGFSRELELLREKLVDFASLLELEARLLRRRRGVCRQDKTFRTQECHNEKITRLANSYSSGAALKNGAGSHSRHTKRRQIVLLNLLLSDDKAPLVIFRARLATSLEDTAK